MDNGCRHCFVCVWVSECMCVCERVHTQKCGLFCVFKEPLSVHIWITLLVFNCCVPHPTSVLPCLPFYWLAYRANTWVIHAREEMSCRSWQVNLEALRQQDVLCSFSALFKERYRFSTGLLQWNTGNNLLYQNRPSQPSFFNLSLILLLLLRLIWMK